MSGAARRYRTGKLAPKHDARTFRFGSFLTPELPAPPTEVDTLARFKRTLGWYGNYSSLMPMDGNDQLGDCTIAAKSHLVTLWEGLAGRRVVAGDETVREDYFRLSGGADDGLAMLDVLRDWRLLGFAGTPPILGFVKVDHTNLIHVKQAIWLFGAVYVGFAFTELSEEQFDARVPWTDAPKTGDGHAVMIPSYFGDSGGWASTWGGFASFTWDWWWGCVDEAWAIAPAEAADPRFFAPGFDHSRFVDALQALT